MEQNEPPTVDGGWIRWFDDNRLQMLCWKRNAATGEVWGMELEMSALLSRLIASFPECPQYMTLLLRDGNNRTLHQSGTKDVAKRKADSRISLGPELPHWELAAYLHLIPSKTKTVWPAAGIMLVIIFLTAIICGGLILTSQSQRNWHEAQRKTTFVSNVSHELKTPLTTIRMYSEMLLLGRVSEESKRERYLKTVVTECGRLTRLVNNVLDFSRLEQNRRTYRIEEIELSAFVATLIDTHRPRIEAAGLQVTESRSDHLINVCADHDALEQVILNIVDNVIKYAAEGKTLEICAEATQQNALISIMDQGPGIPAAHRKRIFDAFHRVDDSITAGKPGSGLGLSIALRLISGMKGTLQYRPRPGGGSTFEIRLPLKTALTTTESSNA